MIWRERERNQRFERIHEKKKSKRTIAAAYFQMVLFQKNINYIIYGDRREFTRHSNCSIHLHGSGHGTENDRFAISACSDAKTKKEKFPLALKKKHDNTV